jgi:hypothetical protein
MPNASLDPEGIYGRLPAEECQPPNAGDDSRLFDQHNGGNGADREPRCDRCGLLGGTECYYDGLQVWLHPQCTRPWIDSYEVRRRNGAGASS